MFTKQNKKQVYRLLEKTQMYLIPFQEESDELQGLRQGVIHLQIVLDRIIAEDAITSQDIKNREKWALG